MWTAALVSATAIDMRKRLVAAAVATVAFAGASAFSWDGYDYETSETRTLDMDLFIRKDHRFKTLVDVRECRKAKASLKTVDGGPLK